LVACVMDDTFITIIECEDQLSGEKRYFLDQQRLDVWLAQRYNDRTVRIPLAPDYEQKMLKIRGLVMGKADVLKQNLLPDWPETVKYQKAKLAQSLVQAKEFKERSLRTQPGNQGEGRASGAFASVCVVSMRGACGGASVWAGT
jgi:hypothetical protein